MPHSLSRFHLPDAVVSVDQVGAVSSVVNTSRPTLSYLRMDLPTAAGADSGARTGSAVAWSSVGVAIDVDELESALADRAGLELTVRHTFVAGWQLRCALANSSTEPRTLRLRLPLTTGAGTVGHAVAEGAEAELFVQPGDGRGPILAGRLRQGSVERIDADGLVLPELTLDPGARYVLSWEWDWLPNPAAYVRRRATMHPIARTVIRGQAVMLPGGPDVAVVTSDDVVLESAGAATYELSSVEPLAADVELRSARGLRQLRLRWTPTAGELLRRTANELLAVPPGPLGVVGLPGLAAALTVQWTLGAEILDAPDDAADALDLFTARLVASGSERAMPALYLCGEYERTGDRDVLEAASGWLLAAAGPEPGLGVAATRVCLARVALGLSPQPIMDQLLTLARDAAGDDVGTQGVEVGRLAAAAELLAVTRTVDPSSRTSVGVADEALLCLVDALGGAVGAGLPGDRVRPLSARVLGHVLTVLRLLPDALAEPTRGIWGVPAADLAGQLIPTLIARLLDGDVDRDVERDVGGNVDGDAGRNVERDAGGNVDWGAGRKVGWGHVWLALLAGGE